MTRNFICIVFSSICSMGIPCAADEHPNELIAFLAPDMKVGINRDFKSTEDIEIHIWSERRFQMELDARRLPFIELAEKYPTVAEAAKKEEARTAAHRNKEHLETIWRSQNSPMKILHVGKDYVLLQSAEDPRLTRGNPGAAHCSSSLGSHSSCHRHNQCRFAIRFWSLTRGPNLPRDYRYQLLP